MRSERRCESGPRFHILGIAASDVPRPCYKGNAVVTFRFLAAKTPAGMERPCLRPNAACRTEGPIALSPIPSIVTLNRETFLLFRIRSTIHYQRI